MKKQNCILLSFLYLASTLATIQAETYNGTGPIVIGQPWSITCQGGPDDNFQSSFEWRKNGQTIQELSNAQIKVELNYNMSTLSSLSATEAHDGKYSCLKSNSKDSYDLTIIRDYTPKIKEDKTTLSIVCPITSNVEWKMEVDVIKNNTKPFTVFENGTLIVNGTESDDNIFNKTITCAQGNSTTPAAQYKIFPKPIPVISQHSAAVEGEKMTLVCGNKKNVYPGIKIKWQHNNKDINDTNRITYKSTDQNIENSIIIIEKLALSDAGTWSCRAAYDKNGLNDDKIEIATTELRVKDKFAALWPFLGICAEVVILCAIILIYEKKRDKSDLEESDTDQSPDTKPVSNKDSDVRHRK